MAKCGHDICPDENCGWNNILNGGRRARCRRIQGCFETACSSLKALGPSGFVLYDACLGDCHKFEGDPTYPLNYATPNEYVCQAFDPLTLVDYFGVNPCELSEDQTTAGKKKVEESKLNTNTTFALLAIAAIIAGLLWALLGGKK